MKLFISGLFILLITISFISASGLQIEGTNSFNITKIIGQDSQITFQIRNNDTFQFTNISFEDNNFITMSKIPILDPGSIVTVNATITSNQDLNQPVLIQGYYESNLGMSNSTIIVDVDYNNGIFPCGSTMVKGDHVIFNNLVNDDIKMINSQTGNEITTILKNSSYQLDFPNPETLVVHFTRRGFVFTDQCSYVALNDVGYVTNPNYDATINLNIKNTYEPTNLNALFLQNDFNMDFYDFTEGIFQLTNNGTNIAKNIELSGEWYTFSKNNFDLNIGETTTVGFTIKPQITSTNETNKTHSKIIYIKGNFPTVEHTLNIYINYANIDSGNYSGSESITDFITQYCTENPDISWCGPQGTVYLTPNKSGEDFNVTFNTEQVKQMYEYFFSLGDDQEVFQNFMKERYGQSTEDLSTLRGEMVNLTSVVKNIESKNSSQNTTMYIVIILVFMMINGSIIGFVIYKHKQKTNLDKLKRMYD